MGDNNTCGYRPLMKTFTHVPLVILINLSLGVLGMFLTVYGSQQQPPDSLKHTLLLGFGIVALVTYGIYLLLFLYLWCYIKKYSSSSPSHTLQAMDIESVVNQQEEY
jgi:hypothetical protein